MADAEINLSNGDVWDDSALIDSWNQALDEYKKYHSIYAGKSKGLQPASPPHQPPAASTASAPGPEAADVPESQKLDAKTETNKVPTVPGTRETSAGKETTGSVADPNGVANARIAPPPEALIGSGFFSLDQAVTWKGPSTHPASSVRGAGVCVGGLRKSIGWRRIPCSCQGPTRLANEKSLWERQSKMRASNPC
ncbi:hypothetical protein RB598_009025 [Gaeumannomyces tritici]